MLAAANLLTGMEFLGVMAAERLYGDVLSLVAIGSFVPTVMLALVVVFVVVFAGFRCFFAELFLHAVVNNSICAVDRLLDVDVERSDLAYKVIGDVQLEELGEIFGDDRHRIHVDVAVQLGAIVFNGEVLVATVYRGVESLL